MERVRSFEQFLNSKKKHIHAHNSDNEQRKLEWLNSIDQLYLDIKKRLAPFEAKSLLQFRETEIELYEEPIGIYKAKQLTILLGDALNMLFWQYSVSFIPKGTFIIGLVGRVDVKGPKGDVMLIQQTWNKWQFARRSPKLESWPFSTESLEEVIQDLIQ